MIKSIEIENFRGIQQGKLDGLTPLTILVGPNGCGKSTVLDAVYIAAHRDPAVALQYIVKSRLRLPNAPRWVLWRINEKSRCGLRITYEPGAERAVILGLSTLTEHDALRGLSESFQRLGPYLNQLLSATLRKRNAGLDGDAGIPAAEAGLAAWDVHGTKGGTEIDLIDLNERQESEYLVDLFTRTRVAGRRDEVTDLVRSVIPTAVAIEILTENGKPVIHVGYESTSVPAALSGDGIHDLLRICLEFSSRADGVVLLEEPEVHQHPGALFQTARAIFAAVRRGVQVILTTHDLELIDFLLSEAKCDAEMDKVSVTRLKLDDGCLKSSTLSGTEAALSRFQIEDDLR